MLCLCVWALLCAGFRATTETESDGAGNVGSLWPVWDCFSSLSLSSLLGRLQRAGRLWHRRARTAGRRLYLPTEFWRCFFRAGRKRSEAQCLDRKRSGPQPLYFAESQVGGHPYSSILFGLRTAWRHGWQRAHCPACQAALQLGAILLPTRLKVLLTPPPYLAQVRPSRAIDTPKAPLARFRIHAAPSPRLARGDQQPFARDGRPTTKFTIRFRELSIAPLFLLYRKNFPKHCLH